MDETEKFVLFLKEKFSKEEINLAKYVFNTQLLTYSMINENVMENGKEISKSTNILDLSYLKLCAKNFNDSEDLLEKIFLTYIGYTLTEYRNTWRLNLNNLEVNLKSKCTYCNIDSSICPFKLVSYIKKCIADNNFDAKKIFRMLCYEEKREISSESKTIGVIADEVNKYIKNSMDILGAEMLLVSDSIRIERQEQIDLVYKQLDFDVKNNSFFNNLNEYFNQNKGTEGKFNLNNIEEELGENYSYIFDRSPIKLAVYLRYLCLENNLSENELIDKLLEKRNFKESEFRIPYYNQYVHSVKELECSEKEKEEIIAILTYIRNYYFNEDLPYIHFNIALYTKNNLIIDKVVNIINKFARTFNYIGNKPTLWADAEILVRKSKDSTDIMMQVEALYSKNDFIIFENLGKIKNLNEYRVDGLLAGIEKFSMRNPRAITVFIEDEAVLKDITEKHPAIESTLINKKIYIDGFDVEKIRNKVVQKLETIMKIDNAFLDELTTYIENTYNPNTVNECVYISNLCNKIIFDKFKTLDVNNSFEKEDAPKTTATREIKEIMDDINSLIGITEVKDKVNELLKYLEYSKKIDTVRIC